MQKYTANYANTSSNFVLQNLPPKQHISDEIRAACCIVRNILQRGKPSRLSHFLQDKIGVLHELEDWNESLLLINSAVPQWKTTIKGDDDNRYYPAREFFNALPDLFPDYPFLHNLVIPEVLLTDILGNIKKDFHEQQVDFYVPAAKLVIEIDGQQHKTHDATSKNDKQRDEALNKAQIKTIRIDTQDWREQNDRFQQQISAIQQRLQEFNGNLQLYVQSYEHLQNPTEAIILNKLLPTAIMRLQILALELVERGVWRVDDKEWKLQILNHDQYVPIKEACKLALEDVWSWLSNALKLQGQVLTKPNVALEPIQTPDEWLYDDATVRLDFSIIRRWTDEHTDYSRVVYLRADYYDIAEKDYYTVSTSSFTPYTLIKDGEKSNYDALQFFLKNIFGYDDFNNGQFGIIQNALAGRSTIGLLPTGGGKSLCYQLAVFLQPGISFVVAPIKSLMYDQVDEMKKLGIDRIACITSDFSAEEKQQITQAFEQSKYWFILISPERFQTEDFREKYKTLAKNKPLGFAVIDEVHCMSEWGHDFRTSYLNLVPTIRRFSPDIRLLGLTATASINVLRNIQVEFGELNNNNIKTLLDFTRSELEFKVIQCSGTTERYSKLKELANTHTALEHQELEIISVAKCGIIFTKTPNEAYNVSEAVSKAIRQYVGWFTGQQPSKSNMEEAEFNTYKQQIQQDFKDDNVTLLAATKAFGMGVNKKNVFFTIHYGIPGSMEALYQEAGRAGRDKMMFNEQIKAHCTVLFMPEYSTQEKLDRLWKAASIEEIQAIQKAGGFDKDLSTPVYFLAGSRKPIQEELKILQELFALRSSSKINISARNLKYFATSLEKKENSLKEKNDIREEDLDSELQKAIYRLTTLGIIKDWTVNFKTKAYTIEFTDESDQKPIEQTIYQTLLAHIRKYDAEATLSEGGFAHYARTLLQWSYDKHVNNRLRSLKNVYELCCEFENVGAEGFKSRLEKYFKFSAVSYFFQHIADNPNDYSRWFQALYSKATLPDVNEQEKEIQEFALDIVPTDQDFMPNSDDFGAAMNRMLESYQNSTGLNFLSGLYRLMTNDFDNVYGRELLLKALNDINDTSKALYDHRMKILDATLLHIVPKLESHQRQTLGEMVAPYYSERSALAKIYKECTSDTLLSMYLNKAAQDLTTINHSLLYGKRTNA